MASHAQGIRGFVKKAGNCRNLGNDIGMYENVMTCIRMDTNGFKDIRNGTVQTIIEDPTNWLGCGTHMGH